ncbi:MAG: hypothetical protein R3250_14260 [Melioribacteraceae bacterium]|nr:hypothetical protein [Melioribacteraceae bacterium]
MSESVKKLSFDNMNFKFMAAYGQYSDKFDEAESEERKMELNEAITQLHVNEITYPDYYSILDEESDERRKFFRARINTTRKFAYRANERKVDRIKRHK